MATTNKTTPTTEKMTSTLFGSVPAEEWPGIDSRFRLIVVASLRNKQLVRGAHPRIAADPLKHRNTSIALEEVKQGLVPFTLTVEPPAEKGEPQGEI